MSNITVSLPDGSERELPDGATALDLARSIGSRLAKAAVAATVDGKETDLTAGLPDGSVVAIITEDTPEGRHVLRHSTSHVMAQAVTRLFPGAKYAIGPTGQVKWKVATADKIVATPVIGSNGNVLVGSEDEHLYAIAPDGTLLWHLPFSGDIDTTPAIASDGTIYVAGDDGQLHAFR